jgi:hypothetical protein
VTSTRSRPKYSIPPAETPVANIIVPSRSARDGSYPDKHDHDSGSAAYRSLSHQSTGCSVRLLPA